MWLFTKDGFFSVVHKDCKPDEVLVRARVRGDLERLQMAAGFESKIVELRHADYRFRTIAPKEVIGAYLTHAVASMDYDNFKSSLPHKTTADKRRSRSYMRVWTAMFELQNELD